MRRKLTVRMCTTDMKMTDQSDHCGHYPHTTVTSHGQGASILCSRNKPFCDPQLSKERQGYQSFVSRRFFFKLPHGRMSSILLVRLIFFWRTVSVCMSSSLSVPPPRGHWVGDIWIPPEGQRLYTTDEMRQLFAQECILFVGDSLQRRVADTAHLMLQPPPPPTTTTATPLVSSSAESVLRIPPAADMHTPDVPHARFTDEYFKQKKHDRGFARRNITTTMMGAAAAAAGGGAPEDDVDARNVSFSDPNTGSSSSSSFFSNHNQQRRRLGCLDTDWRPLLSDVEQFAIDYRNDTDTNNYQDYTLIVVGSTIWDVVGSSRVRTSARQLRQRVNDTLYALAENIPSHIPIVYKTSGWCADCPWTESETAMGRGDNYKVLAANEQAQETIRLMAIDDDNERIFLVDWGREVLPRSLGADRLASNDGNPYHYGLTPRLVFLQMLCHLVDTRLHQQRKSNREESILASDPNSGMTEAGAALPGQVKNHNKVRCSTLSNRDASPLPMVALMVFWLVGILPIVCIYGRKGIFVLLTTKETSDSNKEARHRPYLVGTKV